MNDEARVQLRAARGWLLGEMQRWGVDERWHLIVAGPRVTRDERERAASASGWEAVWVTTRP